MFNLINIAKAQIFEGGIVKCGPKSLGYAEECNGEQFFILLHDLINYAVEITAILVGIAIVYAGVMFFISGGSSEKLTQGKGALKAAVTGFIIVILAWTLVNTIITVLLPNSCHNWYNFKTGQNFICTPANQ